MKNDFRRKKVVYALFIFYISLALLSCGEDTDGNSKPEIVSVTPVNTFIGDIITIDGKNFGSVPANGKVVFSNGAEVKASDCQKWNDILIRLTIPKGAATGGITVTVGKLSSKAYNVNIEIIPPLEMVNINPGKFTMGSNTGLNDEQPASEVTITYAFSVSKYEINQRIWENITGYNPSVHKDDNLPVHGITWIEAVSFCNSLSTAKGLNPCYVINKDTVKWDTTANGYRLPTEAEWEYACRSGSANDFAGTGKIDEMAWYGFNSGYKPHPSGQKQPNAWSLYDMHGNVWEWCWDFYSPDYYQFSPKVNPSGPASGTIHSLRGGSWADGNTFCRSSNRTVPDQSDERCGLRIVRGR